MGDSLAALVLAAGAGTRLAPLTRRRPKPLCPVAGVALVDHGLDRASTVTTRLAVNVHHGRDEVAAHVEGRAHVSVEADEALGTAGAVGRLRDWIGDDDLLVLNGDTWCPGDLAPIVASWDHERVRVVVAAPQGPAALEPRSRIVASLMPAAVSRTLAAEPTGLFEVCWRPLAAAGRLDVVGWDGPLVDCATPRDYLAANLAASGGESVVGDGAVVEGTLTRCVVWPGARVGADEVLVDAIRVDSAMTVLIR